MAAVADATITATDPSSLANSRSVQTDADGRARLTGLAAGTYLIEATSSTAGMGAAQVSLGAGESRALTLILRGGSPTDADAGVDAGDNDALPPSDAGDAGATTSSQIQLQALTKDTNGVNLRWTSSASFPTYRIYRGPDPGTGYSIIDILNTPTAVTYRDETVALGVSYRYRVAGVGSDGVEVSSNVQSISAGVFIDVGSQVERMAVDPQRPYIYAIDRVNNSLHFVNLATQTVDKTIFVGSAPTGLDINATDTELYVANSGSTEIAVVDLTTQAKTRSLLVDVTPGATSGNPYRVVATVGNTLVFSTQDTFSSLRLVNAATGATITTATSSSSGGSIVGSPDGTHVYTGGYTLTRFDIVGATMKSVDTSTSDFTSLSTTVARSGDGTFIYYGTKKVLAANLKSTLGTFPEIIQVASSDGSLAIGTIRVYDGNTFSANATLPVSTAVAAISPDNKTLYLYETISSRIYIWMVP